MIKNIVYTSSSVDQTQSIAEKLSSELRAGDCLCMYGDLGAGKTAFVQGLAKGLGVSDYVNSPTFTIVNEYEGRFMLYHFDVYRISDPDEMFDIGFDEYLNNDGICVIEWAELIEDILPEHRCNIHITKENDDNTRKIKIEVI